MTPPGPTDTGVHPGWTGTVVVVVVTGRDVGDRRTLDEEPVAVDPGLAPEHETKRTDAAAVAPIAARRYLLTTGPYMQAGIPALLGCPAHRRLKMETVRPSERPPGVRRAVLAPALTSVWASRTNHGADRRSRRSGRKMADHHSRRRRRRRRHGLFVAIGVLVVGGAAVFGWRVLATGDRPGRQATGAPRRGGHVPVSTTTSTTLPPTTTTTTTDPGLLPQTTVFPSTQSPQFESEMRDLFGAIVMDSPPIAQPAYFPESAYLQLKTISNARSDYVDRLEGDFALDVGAAHALLGSDANTAELLEVTAPPGFGHWVPPGVCDNSVGYFELPNARVLYQEDGQIRSFGIASMISWRGVWYVVHLGAILRSSDQGLVDDPSPGPGTSLPSSTC